MIINRYGKNPVLTPNSKDYWESQSAYNGCPVMKDSKVYFFYRALSFNQYHSYPEETMELSTIGRAESKDGINFNKRKKFIYPENDWERYGCEDPRVNKLGDKYYIFYTALSTYPFSGTGIKSGVAISKDLKKIDEKHLVTPFNSKAMAIFPEKIKGKIWSIFSFHTDFPPAKICLAGFDKEKDMWSEDYWKEWYKNVDENTLMDTDNNDGDHIEVGSQPIKTEKGWLLFYSHINNYYSDNKVFGIGALLLDLKNPKKVIAKTEGPILVPEEYYEREGVVEEIVFPSGALIKGDWVYLYYGAADTTCCLAFIKLDSLFDQMFQGKHKNLSFKRPRKKPILSPNEKNDWESKAVLNPAALYLDGKFHILYRAMSEDNTSVLGYATSKDGVKINYKSSEPVYIPREDFEKKKVENGNSGCEDPRLTKIGNTIYLLYTAFNGEDNPRVAISSISEKDFLNRKWDKWSKPQLISPSKVGDKDACLFPEKINGKYYYLHRIENDIDLCSKESLDFKKKYPRETKWLSPRKGWWDSEKIGAAAPPIKTEYGWILFYHGISKDHTYSVGAVLLDLENPEKVLSRTDTPIFTPEKDYEKEGVVGNVVFPCGAVLKGKKIFIYYGGADKYVGVATISLDKLLKKLHLCRTQEWSLKK